MSSAESAHWQNQVQSMAVIDTCKDSIMSRYRVEPGRVEAKSLGGCARNLHPSATVGARLRFGFCQTGTNSMYNTACKQRLGG